MTPYTYSDALNHARRCDSCGHILWVRWRTTPSFAKRMIDVTDAFFWHVLEQCGARAA